MDPRQRLVPDRQGPIGHSLVASLQAVRCIDAGTGADAAEHLLVLAQATGQQALQQLARLVLAERLLDAARDDRVLEVVDATLPGIERRQPATAYLPAVWLVAHRAYVRTGPHEEGQHALDRGLAWVQMALDSQVPDALRRSFLTANSVNRDLCAAHAWGQLTNGKARQPGTQARRQAAEGPAAPERRASSSHAGSR